MKAVANAARTLLCLTCLAPLPALEASPALPAASTPPAASPASPATPAIPATIAVHAFQHAGPPPPSPVQVTRGADGRRVILNETPVQHARRFATALLPVPDLPGLPSIALEPLIRRHCDAHNLDPRLVRAVIQVESGFNLRARSNKGAMGLMQLMPATAVELAVRDPYDVEENLRGGITYLRQLIDTFAGSLEMALAAYNAGAGAVERHRGVPPYPETVDYVRRVMALYRGDNPGSSWVGWQWHGGQRPAPYVVRGASGRLLVTTSLSSLR